MAKHWFGIMQKAPEHGEEYVTFEPQKYGCVPVDDDALQPRLEALCPMDCYWHSLDRPEKGLTYTGITLIPPASLGTFLAVLDGAADMEALQALLMRAQAEHRFVIHYGL